MTPQRAARMRRLWLAAAVRASVAAGILTVLRVHGSIRFLALPLLAGAVLIEGRRIIS